MKAFKFIYEDTEYFGDSGDWPNQTTIKARHEFDDTATWVIVLYQFVKFLESSGYMGVAEKIKVEDNYGMNADCGFETYKTEDAPV